MSVKYPAHSVKGGSESHRELARRAVSGQNQRPAIVIIIGATLVWIAACWMLAAWAMGADAAPPSNAPASNAHILPDFPTLTQPAAATPRPSRTPFPTIPQETASPKIRVVEITRIVDVEQVRVVDVSPTPQPSLTPNATATYEYKLAEIRLDRMRAETNVQNRSNFVAWAGWGSAFIVFWFFAGRALWVSWQGWQAGQKDNASGQTTADDLTAKVRSETPVDAHPLIDISLVNRRKIKHMAAQKNSQAAIEREVFGFSGGTAYERVKRVIDYYDAHNRTPLPELPDA